MIAGAGPTHTPSHVPHPTRRAAGPRRRGAPLPGARRRRARPTGPHAPTRSASSAPPALFRADERALVSAIADAVLPRTDTPGALDVNVPAFVEVLVSDWMTDAERAGFREGLAALDAHALATERERVARSLPRRAVARTRLGRGRHRHGPVPAQRAFRRLKGFVLHGYLTSARVQREVFRSEIAPGRYLGCVAISDAGDDDA
jgi:gluconate 2-dehydrogenase gamma chain